MARISLSGNSDGGAGPGRGGRIAVTVFLSFFALMGSLFMVLLVRDVVRSQAAYGWTALPCQILQSSFELPGGSHDGYKLRVVYRYSVAGRDYTSEQYELNPQTSRDFEPIQRALLEFAAGSSARCYVNPSKPDEAVLHLPSRTQYAAAIIPLIFMLIGFGGIWLVWRGKSKPKPQAISAGSRINPRYVSLFIFGMFLVVGGGITLALTVPTVVDFLAARSWTPTPAVVVASRVTESRGDKSTTYGIDVLYRYDIAGKTYHSNRYKLLGGSSSGRAAKQQVVNEHRPGTKVTAYVNSADPVQAVLVRDFTWDLLLAAIPVAPMLIGLVGVVATLLKQHATQKPMWNRSTPAAPSGPAPPVVLSSGSVRRGKFIGLLIFSIFWNAISWGIAYGIWRSGGGWFPLLFIGIFILAGLAMIAGAIHTGLAMLNPSIEITFSTSPLRLGEGVTLNYRFTGRYERVSKLVISIEGREWVRYRRGTDTRTDTATFLTRDLVNTTRPADIPMGKCVLAIPPNSMHSFDASDNKIQWFIIVKGEVPNWPDINDEFPIQILPLDLSKRRTA